MILPSLLVYVVQDGPDESSTARVQRGPSEGARCASTGDSPGHPSLLAGLFSILLDPWVHPFRSVLSQLFIIAPHVRMVVVELS
jgi:hypothetical protein